MIFLKKRPEGFGKSYYVDISACNFVSNSSRALKGSRIINLFIDNFLVLTFMKSISARTLLALMHLLLGSSNSASRPYTK